jgi:hypothetical protein
LAVVHAGGFAEDPGRPPSRSAGAGPIDDEAYGFNLPVFDFSEGIERATEESFDLQAIARERPAALIFGSYT